MEYQILENDFATGLFTNCQNLKIIPTLDQIDPVKPAVFGGDILRSDVRYRISLQLPTIFVHRGYLGNHLYKQRKWWRFSANGFANTKLLSVPHSRWGLLNLPKHPWKVKEVRRVLIAPSKMTSKIWSPELKFAWAESMLDKFPGAEVKIRYKQRTPGERWSNLWEDLDWADLVVAQSSAITAEAFWYGKKVISPTPCPTWAAEKTTMEDWRNPREPELRDQWHEHIAWCQYTNEEWANGTALTLIENYIGNVVHYDPGHAYNFKS